MITLRPRPSGSLHLLDIPWPRGVYPRQAVAACGATAHGRGWTSDFPPGIRRCPRCFPETPAAVAVGEAAAAAGTDSPPVVLGGPPGGEQYPGAYLLDPEAF